MTANPALTKASPKGEKHKVAIAQVIADPAASDLLRFLCAKYLAHDPIDAAHELEYAARLFGQRADAILEVCQ